MLTITLRPIVLVDDDVETPFFLRRLLQRIGAPNPLLPILGGDEAHAYFERAATSLGGVEVPLATFLNVNMPRIDGFDMLRLIRSREALARMPVIMLSDSSDQRHVELARNLGAEAYVTKFPPLPDLREILEQAHHVRRAGPTILRVRSNLMMDDCVGGRNMPGLPTRISGIA